MQKRVGVVGANGYSGRELCGLLARHPHAHLVTLASRQYAGRTVAEVLPRLAKSSGVENLNFAMPSVSALLDSEVEIAFLALPHGLAAEFALPLLEAGIKVIDLSADFRLKSVDTYQKFYGKEHPTPHLLSEAVYGLPEFKWNRERLRAARLVACPGCYPTSILLPLIPLFLSGGLQPKDLCIASASGISGAGRRPEISLLFGECDESFRAYGMPQHRHVSEIEEQLSYAAQQEISVSFVPHLIPVRRGIHTTIFAVPQEGMDVIQVRQIWGETYAESPFVRINDALPDIKNVSMTNFCDLATCSDLRNGKLLIFSAIDNLLKGAAGQAIQCFNLMNGFIETEGLLS